MSSVVVANRRFANLLQDPLLTLHSSSREELIMPQLAFSRLSRPTGTHSLPVELLSLIFLLGSAFDDPYADSPFLLKPDQEYKPVPSSNFQVVVSHVCQHWRQVALSTQSLWTTLHFRDPSHLSRAKVYLGRCSTSTAYLLDVLVDTVAVEDHVSGLTLYKNELYAIFQIIIPHVKQWRAFHLKISDNECKGIARLFLGTCGGAPNLETLQLYHFENYLTSQRLYLATYRPPVAIFANSLPRMKNISLIGVNLPWETIPYFTKLHNLELALHSETVRPVYSFWDTMLRCSVELKTLSLHYSGPKEATDDPARAWPSADNKIRLEKLRELNFTDLDPAYLCNLVERLCLPSLKRLTLELPEQDYTPFIELITGPPSQQSSNRPTRMEMEPTSESDSTPQPSVPVLPIPSLFNLEILIVHALECSIASWISFLRAAQGLQILKVDFYRVGVAFWNVFTQDSQTLTLGVDDTEATPKTQNHLGRGINSILLPHLMVFELTGVSGEDIVSALRYRHSHRREWSPNGQEWIVGCSERRRNKDFELDTLIKRGFWTPDDENAPDEAKVIIREYYEDDEDEDGEDEDGEESEESED